MQKEEQLNRLKEESAALQKSVEKLQVSPPPTSPPITPCQPPGSNPTPCTPIACSHGGYFAAALGETGSAMSDSSHVIRVDRDAAPFQHVLSWMRTGRLVRNANRPLAVCLGRRR